MKTLNLHPIIVSCVSSVIYLIVFSSVQAEPQNFRVEIRDGPEIYLLAAPQKNEGYIKFSAKFTGTGDNWKKIYQINRKKPLNVKQYYAIPFSLLLPEYKKLAINLVFPDDKSGQEYWTHIVGKPSPTKKAETLSAISIWFTGNSKNSSALMKFNNLSSDKVIPGQKILIPNSLLMEVLRPPITSKPSGSGSDLVFKKDEEGEYAGYKLKRGEAIYSDVVIRFTGRVETAEVNEMVEIIARRSGIDDFHQLPVGFEVKIPIEYLSPEYLPANNLARVQYEAHQEELKKYQTKLVSKNLEDVHIILDPGHGGKDTGAIKGMLCEDEMVYDIACRIKQILENKTKATVYMTIIDQSRGFKINNGKFYCDEDEELLTTPRYPLSDPILGTNLRWYLVNSIFNKLTASNIRPENIIFISIHADARHKASRGTMVYVADSTLCKDKWGRNDLIYLKYNEVKEEQWVTMSIDDRLRSEALSTELGEIIIRKIKEKDLPVHPNKPVRNYIIRGKGKKTVPAVLRFTKIPLKILIETLNLSNSLDRKLIKNADYRQQISECIVGGIIEFYSLQPKAPEAQTLLASEDNQATTSEN